ncbi:Bgt-1564 [Blumeria graminis f. sp. tritici]|uniref:Bgt-1564 n=2 Tax=Blumeria graminis f. sp. tritici TaxID=62690 RepID=A0A381LHW1_BLUGR|nr:Hsp70 (Ssa1p) nucleotide exchange factor [Blumeria graminis f. sp. tritici 96224]VDB84352.1 Bgt-1564 [Blumeria graminis f. sp. tritici]
MDPNLSQLLQWSVANSTAPGETVLASNGKDEITSKAINALFGGPSDADLMMEAMNIIISSDPSIALEDKIVAFDNLEQLIENLDNANNLAPLALWTPLLGCLSHKESELRRMAAWCIGTAVQNNVACQEILVANTGLAKLAQLAVGKDEEKSVRRKAMYALSSACRNHQPAMNILICELENLGRGVGPIDATDMDACDLLFGALREEVL